MAHYLTYCDQPELVTLPVNIVYKERIFSPENKAENTAFSEHNHSALEILYITGGELYLELEKRPYRLKKGDVVLFNSYDIHKGWFEGAGTHSYLCLTSNIERILKFFEKSVLKDAARDLMELRSGFDHYYPAGTDIAQRLGGCIGGIYEAFYKKTFNSECAVLQNLFGMLSALFDGYYHMTDANARHNVDFLRSVSEYVSEHFRQNITTADIAAALFMTPSNFCHQFNQNFGCSFLKYLREYRVQVAKSYLGSGMSISQIASEVGFSDYCYFSRSFKKYVGQSPAVFFGIWKTECK